MSTRRSIFLTRVIRADGHVVSVHAFIDGWGGGTQLEVSDVSAAVRCDLPVAPTLLDSIALTQLAKKLAAYERAERFVQQFGFGLWRWDHLRAP
jgi:hypothetical protein